MDFCIPTEVRDLEKRVGLTPAGVLALTQAGHTVYVQREAGTGAGFGDDQYRTAGAKIVYSAAEAFGRARVVVKVARPTPQEHSMFTSEQILFGFLHMPVSSPDVLEAFAQKQITAIAYEMIREEDGRQPVLLALSQVAGRLAPVIAGQLLTNSGGGRGIILSGIPGVPPAAVVILGGGVLGTNAARAFSGLGAQVTVVDQNPRQLHRLDDHFAGQITTMLSNDYNINRVIAFADVLVGCVQIPGQRAPILVTKQMVSRMRPGAVIIDFSIDNGGCIETSRPTTLRDSTFIEAGIVHYCVPNVSASVARTASHALTNASLPYLLELGNLGLANAINSQFALRKGVTLFQGKLASRVLSAALGRSLEIDLSTGVPV